MPEKTKCEICGKLIKPNDSPAVPYYEKKVQDDQREMFRHATGECR